VGSITGNFQRETPLHPAAREFLADAFDRGWADPQKIPAPSRQVAILLNEAKENLSSLLGIRANQLHFLSNPALGFHLGLSGLLKPASALFFSGVDRSEVQAVAHDWESRGGNAVKLPVSLNGATAYPPGGADDLLSWQMVNGETGIYSPSPQEFQGNLFVDATAQSSIRSLPNNWTFSLWNPQSWQGPSGIGIFATSQKSKWRNPLPHLDTRTQIGSFSAPLAIASALAAEAHFAEMNLHEAKILRLNQLIREFAIKEIGDVDIAGDAQSSSPHLLSLSFLYIDAERLLHELDRQGYYVDSGSACSSSALEPSHVLATMGLLTQGNIRLTLRPSMTEEVVTNFLLALKECVLNLRI
jgi:cysteine desulfurase